MPLPPPHYMDLTFHVSPWEIWGVVVLVWGLVICSWQKEQKDLKVVQGKVGESGRDTVKKSSPCYSPDPSPPRGEARVKRKRAHKGMQ